MTYKSKTKYKYSYKQIANVLCFTDEDIKLSYCNFSDERKANARKERNAKYYESKVHKAGKETVKEKRLSQIDYIRENTEYTDKQLMEILGIGKTTFYKLKKLAKADEKTSEK